VDFGKASGSNIALKRLSSEVLGGMFDPESVAGDSDEQAAERAC
jgi:hypothetical protein